MLKQLIACATIVALQAGTAYAGPSTSAPYMTGSYNIAVTEGLSYGYGFTTGPALVGAGSANATFAYTGALNFNNTAAQNSTSAGDLNSTFGFSSNNISHYNGSGNVMLGSTTVADYTNVTTFLASSGSASNYQYASLYTIDLGTLAAGTVLDVTHDDGISIYQGTTQIDPTVAGPTSAVTDEVKLSATGDTLLYYSRQNGSPSILQVDVPEPVSFGLLSTGLIGLGWIRRRRA